MSPRTDTVDVFTLAAGDYVYGAAALCNSLRAAGFKGTINVGCTGQLPWTIEPAAAIEIHRISESGKWIGNHKPAFIAKHAKGLFAYIDADCIVTNPGLIESVVEAVQQGPVFCAEGILPGRDVRRLRWRMAKEKGLERRSYPPQAPLPSDVYYNSGFLCGDIPRDRWLLDDWRRMIETALHGSGALYETRDFPMPDQDCLNALLQDERSPFCCISPPDVWYAGSSVNPFLQVGTHEAALLHCTGQEKPWRHTSVPPRAPNPYEKAWLRFLYDDARWVRCPLELKGSVQSWLRDEPWGRRISRAKNFARRLLAR
jgi:hypothetical protein